MLLILIPVILSLAEMFILHNCKHGNGDKVKLPLFLWLLWLGVSFIPYVNVIVVFVLALVIIIGLTDYDLYLNHDHWLFKEY